MECDGVGEVFRVQKDGEQTGHDFPKFNCTIEESFALREIFFLASEIGTCFFTTRILFPSMATQVKNNNIITHSLSFYN
jgi:hypothetical protein